MPTQGLSPSTRSLQGRKAAARRWNHPEDQSVARDFAAAKLAEYIQRTVDSAPPLTSEQRNRLSTLLGGGRA